jgi:solute:Na+ symporter, SSS family
MAWKRPSATAGFYGMLAGLAGTTTEYALYRSGELHLASTMAATLWAAVWGLAAGFVTVVVLSFFSKPPDAETLKGLVFARSSAGEPIVAAAPWYRRPGFFAAVVIAMFLALNILFF